MKKQVWNRLFQPHINLPSAGNKKGGCSFFVRKREYWKNEIYYVIPRTLYVTQKTFWIFYIFYHDLFLFLYTICSRRVFHMVQRLVVVGRSNYITRQLLSNTLHKRVRKCTSRSFGFPPVGKITQATWSNAILANTGRYDAVEMQVFAISDPRGSPRIYKRLRDR